MENEKNNDKNDKKLPKEVLAAIEKGQQVIVLEGAEQTFYFRKPTPVEMKQFMDEIGGDRAKIGSRMDKIVRNCRLSPSADEYDKLLIDKPGLFVSLYSTIQEELGLSESFLLKKL